VVTPTVALRRTARCRSSKTLLSVLLAVGAFLVAGPAAAAIQSDEFNGPTLDTGIWTFVDPVGDASVSMTGSQAMISVPAGSAHDVWGSVDRATRLLQSVPNGDFEVEVKYDSAVSFGYQMQGLIVQQDAGHLLRIEVHTDGGSTSLFAAAIQGGGGTVLHYSTVSGGSPVYLRLQRAGNDWTLRHSLNGSSWTTTATFTHAMTVSAIGPYAGNSGVFPPAFSAQVDYFREIVHDVTPPAISGLAAVPTALGATVMWNTNEPASSTVAYGLDATYAGGEVSQAPLVQSHSVELEGLACGTTYHFQARSSDGADNEAQSGDQTFTTPACPTAVRSDQFNGGALDTSVWSYVDPVGDTSLSMTGTQAAIGLPAGTGHDIWTGVNRSPRLLQPLADQDFEVEAKFDSAVTAAYQMQGLIVQQDPQNLLRLEVHSDGSGTKLFAASVQNGTASTQVYRGVSGGPQAYLRLKRVGNTWTLSYSKDGSTWLAVETFTHAMTVSSLGPFAGNSGGNPPAFTATVDYFREIVPDVTPPTFSNVAVAPLAATAQVTWTTDEPASSEVVYGPTTAYDAGSLRNEARVVSHQLALHGLACGTTFHYQVRSVDSADNEGQSPDGTFTTGPCPTVIASDEFNSGTLDTSIWTFIDPVGDSSLALTGSEAQIGVPAGTRHDLWGGVDEVPRLLQAAPNDNFTVEA
jgi:regulation of enolase protein 1 (concanavalin A-like superfamily)